MNSKKNIFTVGMAAVLSLSACNQQEQVTPDNAVQNEPTTDSVVDNFDTITTAPDTIVYSGNTDVADTTKKQAAVARSTMATKKVKTQADVLHNKIVESAKPIIAEGLQEIATTLAPYNLKINWDARADELMNIFSPYGEDLYCLDNDRQRQFEFAWNQNEFLRVLLQKNRVFSQYDAKTQAEIQRIVIRGYVGTMRELKRNRVAISKEFAAYYPVLNLDGVPQGLQKLFAGFDPAVMHNGNKIAYGYDNLSNSPVCVMRKIQLQASGLNPEFFDDVNAEYKLEAVNNYRWQIVKTTDSGTVAKTPVFYCHADFDTCWEYGARPDADFKATAGEKSGVRIALTQLLYKKEATQNDKVR